MQSLKLVAYSCTAVWLAGIFQILGVLAGLLSLVALHLFAVHVLPGRHRMKKVPADKAVAYTVVVVLCVLVLGALVGSVLHMTMYSAITY